MDEIDKSWHKEQIKLYREEQKKFKLYAETLKLILLKVAEIYDPLAIVQTREKSLSSYAGKIVRKYPKYKHPLTDITDLCGGRIITRLISQVEKISHCIENNFIIDYKNSIDLATALSISEFGYLSIHYIVMIKKDEILGVNIPEAIKEKKAEIQVKTLLQHAWSDILHDRIYKTNITVPQKLHRESARLAAILEKADQSFVSLAGSIDIYESYYGTMINEIEWSKELETLRTILQNEPNINNKPRIALKISNLLKTKSLWNEIIDTLEGFDSVSEEIVSDYNIELGNAYCQQFKTDVQNEKYSLGQQLLSDVALPNKDTELNEYILFPERRKLRAHALCLLANSNRFLDDNDDLARDLYYKAYLLDPNNPFHLVNFLEFELYRKHDQNIINFMRPTIEEAITRCKSYIDAGVEVPVAYCAMGRLWYLLGNVNESSSAYLKAFDLCLNKNAAIADDHFELECRALRKSAIYGKDNQDYKSLIKLLKLAGAVKGAKIDILEDEKSSDFVEYNNYAQMTIVAGRTSGLAADDKESLYSYLDAGFKGYNGVIIAGGTNSDVSGLLGKATKSNASDIRDDKLLVCYIPEFLPSRISKEERYYDRIVSTDGKGFSYLEPIQYWVDIVYSGINPKNVRVIGIGEGEISGFEYRLALALGATVGLSLNEKSKKSDINNDTYWSRHGNLLNLPRDKSTLWFYVNRNVKADFMTSRQLVRIAQLVHLNYQKDQIRYIKQREEQLNDWDNLREDLKHSNIQHVTNIERILKSAGYAIREIKDRKIDKAVFSEDEIELMAKLEHGRWNIERLTNGWRYGGLKNTQERISPYLVPWGELPESIRKYDKNAVRNYPKLLGKLNYEIYKLQSANRE